jgi:hypothetical protein
MLTADELLAGGALTYEVEIPAHLLHPGGGEDNGSTHRVRLRPLTIRDLQLISRAAKESDTLIATLMMQRALVEPEMTVMQVANLHVGLVQYLVNQINLISGITTTPEQIATVTEDPLTKAAFVLAKAFGWTPQQVSELTLGQVLLHLQMLKERAQP